uniref:Chromosome 11 C5orf49 homolog n=1 Tax=Gouania willdenowi TaxID=441366 RepID=A0A8C5E443_GOUWI
MLHPCASVTISHARGKPPINTLSAYSYIPPRRTEPKEMSYFSREPREVFTYDQVFNQLESYDMKVHRDDRRHSQGRGLDINGEEESQVVPVLSSSQYGRRRNPALCHTDPKFARVAVIKANFFMKNGIIWNVEDGYGSVAPI